MNCDHNEIAHDQTRPLSITLSTLTIFNSYIMHPNLDLETFVWLIAYRLIEV